MHKQIFSYNELQVGKTYAIAFNNSEVICLKPDGNLSEFLVRGRSYRVLGRAKIKAFSRDKKRFLYLQGMGYAIKTPFGEPSTMMLDDRLDKTFDLSFIEVPTYPEYTP